MYQILFLTLLFSISHSSTPAPPDYDTCAFIPFCQHGLLQDINLPPQCAISSDTLYDISTSGCYFRNLFAITNMNSSIFNIINEIYSEIKPSKESNCSCIYNPSSNNETHDITFWIALLSLAMNILLFVIFILTILRDRVCGKKYQRA
jgi:hypothetical protein